MDEALSDVRASLYRSAMSSSPHLETRTKPLLTGGTVKMPEDESGSSALIRFGPASTYRGLPDDAESDWKNIAEDIEKDRSLLVK
jgi:hypothetical protein